MTIVSYQHGTVCAKTNGTSRLRDEKIADVFGSGYTSTLQIADVFGSGYTFALQIANVFGYGYMSALQIADMHLFGFGSCPVCTCLDCFGLRLRLAPSLHSVTLRSVFFFFSFCLFYVWQTPNVHRCGIVSLNGCVS
ncbi:hypothetical protein Tco_0448882 [Tanacetum coccineum]